MVGFAGYEMPVNYPAGVLKEHLSCRDSAALFDVSHMGQFKIYGKDRLDFVEKICVGDIENLSSKASTLSLILNDKAGIIDDTIVSKYDDHMYSFQFLPFLSIFIIVIWCLMLATNI
jgi:aminomethyltransferase